jgi:hypothetical protein
LDKIVLQERNCNFEEEPFFMEQLIIDIRSPKDAALIKELMKRFKGVEVNSFSNSSSAKETRKRISQGLKEADQGNVRPWSEVKSKLLKRIKSKSR